MKPKELLFLAVAFFLGYFVNTVINMTCGRPVVEGLSSSEVQGLHECTGMYSENEKNCSEIKTSDADKRYVWDSELSGNLYTGKTKVYVQCGVDGTPQCKVTPEECVGDWTEQCTKSSQRGAPGDTDNDPNWWTYNADSVTGWAQCHTFRPCKKPPE